MKMSIRNSCALALALALGFIVSCGSEDEAPPTKTLGGGVGAACTESAQCTGYTHPACVTEIKPLETLISDADPNNKPLRDLTLPFPGGYCSTTIEQPCTADAECGSGKCFLAFEGVPQSTIDELNQLGLPFDVNAFARIGICLQSCMADNECRRGEGYQCLVPIKAFMDVINPNYPKKYCVQYVDVSNVLR
jgi:hypothetical protein